MDWVVVYDFKDESLRIWWMLIPISFVFIGYGICLSGIFSKRTKVWERFYSIGFGFLFGSFALFFGIGTIPANISRYHDTKQVYRDKQYRTIEGIVKDFIPMPYSGHAEESFTLNGIRFSYSDFDESYYGFNNTKSHGGPIDENMRVRLSYFVSNGKNIILIIEVPT